MPFFDKGNVRIHYQESGAGFPLMLIAYNAGYSPADLLMLFLPAAWLIDRTYDRPWSDRMLRRVLGRVLPNRSLFRLALLGASVGRLFAGAIPSGTTLGRRLRAMLSLAPARVPPPSATETLGTHPAQAPRRYKVALLAGCGGAADIDNPEGASGQKLAFAYFQKCVQPLLNTSAVRLIKSRDRVVGVEALARWTHAELGPIPPDECIVIAEQVGAIEILTRYVLDAALAQRNAWLEQGIDLAVAVNISAQSLADSHFSDRIERALVRHRCPVDRLVLEITEGTMLVDVEGVAVPPVALTDVRAEPLRKYWNVVLVGILLFGAGFLGGIQFERHRAAAAPASRCAVASARRRLRISGLPRPPAPGRRAAPGRS